MENSFAVVTGASSGVGLELARQFGEHGFEVLIVSSSDDIFGAQRALEDSGITVEAMKVNLASYAGVENLYHRIQNYGKALGAIAINAGEGVGGEFTKTDLKDEINLINLNIVSMVHLTKNVLHEMEVRKKGRILFTSSGASEISSPFQAVYGGSKAFITSFADSLRSELKDSGITITTLIPGATSTNPEMKYENDPAEMARLGFEALMEGKDRVFEESMLTKIQGYAMKILPERAKAQLHRKWTEPGSTKHH